MTAFGVAALVATIFLIFGGVMARGPFRDIALGVAAVAIIVAFLAA